MSEEDSWSERAKQALAVLNVQIQAHERYHSQKESLTWLATAAYVGAAMLLLGRDPFWASWPLAAFLLWLLLLLATFVCALIFLQSQFRARHCAAAFFLAASDVAAIWVSAPPAPPELEPTSLRELDGMLVPAAVVRRFREVVSNQSSLSQRVALSLSVVWSLAVGAYVVASYAACRPH